MNPDSVQSEGLQAIADAPDTAALEQVRIALLGRKAPLVLALRELGSLPPEERGPRGKVLNQVRQSLESALDARESELEAAELDDRLRRDRVDVTLPGAQVERGFAHLIEQTGREILEVLVGLGYRISDGPEVDTVYRNFDALNHAPTHPTRQGDGHLLHRRHTVLRTHTSPMQIRTMQSQPPPVYMATMGRCYRRDTPDATHTAMFTQIEGLAVDRGLSLAHLKGTLLAFAREMFGADREVRLRPHFFPFTEPSVEVDVSCFNCARDGSPCRVCKGEGWVEMLGAGHGRSGPVRLRRGLRPRAADRLRLGDGRRADRRAAPCRARHPLAMGERPAADGAVRMRVPVSWLREYVSFDMPVRELGELLSMTGTKLEAVHRIGVPAGAELFRVGRVISREQHPDADRLSLCTVDVGDGEPRQIVCGATNFDAGATVGRGAARRHAAGRHRAARAKLRGVESDGMMLSERELELSGDHEG